MFIKLIDLHNKQNETLKALFISLVYRIPTDNIDGIKKLSKNACIVSFSTIAKHKRFGADYYNLDYQKSCIIQQIKNAPMDKLKSIVDGIISTGYTKDMDSNFKRVAVNPYMAFNLNRILNGDLKWLKKHLRKERKKRKSKKL